MNGELNQAHESLSRAVEEIKKVYEKGEMRFSEPELNQKRTSIKKVVQLAVEYSSYLGRFDAIANNNESHPQI